MKFLYLVWSNLKRRKLRTSLTLLSVFVAFMLFGLLCAIKEAFTAGVAMAGADRLIVRHKVSLIMTLPVNYGTRMAGIPGVKDVVHWTWFNGIYQNEPKNFFPSIPVNPEPFFRVYPEYLLPEDQKQAWRKTRTGAVVGRALAQRFEWEIGDRVPLTSPIWPRKGGDAWEFDIVGIFDGAKKGTDTSGFFFRYDYFDEARSYGEGLVGWYTVLIDDPDRAAEIASAIDTEFANSPHETKAEPEGAFAQAFVQQVGNIGAILIAILSAVFFTILVVAGNTMAQAVRERTEELGVLKALGFTNERVLALVLAESCMIAVVGGLTGLGAAWLMTVGGSPVPSMLPVFYLPTRDLLIGTVFVVGLGLVAGILPALQAMRLQIAVALPEARMINWLSQVFSVTLFNLRTIPQRKGSAITAAVGIAGVAAVLVGVLSIAEGFRAAMTVSGPDDVAIVLRSGADNEMTSGLSRADTRLIADAPGVARTADGPLASAELFVIINLPKRTTGTDANVPMRGVQKAASAVRGNVKIIEGEMCRPGRDEVIVGEGAARSFSGLDVGNTIRVGQNNWTVTGIFTGGGGAAESEIWTDAAVLQPAYNRGDSFQSVYVKLASPQDFQSFKDALTANPQLQVKALRQSDYLADQATMLTGFIQTIGVFIAALMALGALFGALNTMYSAVAARTCEIATLRALGFGSSPVILSVMFESLALALLGGVIGAALAYLAFDGFQAATMNWQTFSQIAFAFSVTPQLLARAIIWAAAIGLLGGLFPALRAARLPIASALRET